MADSLEEMFVATRIKRRLQVPEGALFTTDGEHIYRLVSQNGDQREITVAPISLENGELVDGPQENLYKYGEMVYLVEEGSDEDEEE
ncbi:MAG: hypothetical protein G8345_00595 [Magnetococcales bacterium]|nr:hypothetical protein [Magnetococcales bacterium]NGZ25366.1 hypothetical protein [Magnetococcales bacterium]